MTTGPYVQVSSVLFVCSGNIFRSVIAQHALTHFAGTSLIVRSAGVRVQNQHVSPLVISALRERDIDISNHRPCMVTREFTNASTYIVAMAEEHRSALLDMTRMRVSLFREACFGDSNDVPDLGDVLPNWRELPQETIEKFVHDTVEMIFSGMPALLSKIRNGCLA